jgi:hypothetical protein
MLIKDSKMHHIPIHYSPVGPTYIFSLSLCGFAKKNEGALGRKR